MDVKANDKACGRARLMKEHFNISQREIFCIVFTFALDEIVVLILARNHQCIRQINREIIKPILWQLVNIQK